MELEPEQDEFLPTRQDAFAAADYAACFQATSWHLENCAEAGPYEETPDLQTEAALGRVVEEFPEFLAEPAAVAVVAATAFVEGWVEHLEASVVALLGLVVEVPFVVDVASFVDVFGYLFALSESLPNTFVSAEDPLFAAFVSVGHSKLQELDQGFEQDWVAKDPSGPSIAAFLSHPAE